MKEQENIQPHQEINKQALLLWEGQGIKLINR